jgi:hypothetical protein
MKQSSFTHKRICLVAALVIATAIPIKIQAQDGQASRDEVFTVDVALDGATLVVNHVDPTQPANAAFPGDVLYIAGTIYPGGTLPSGMAENDPNAPGGIGKIRCRALILTQPTDLTTPMASFVTEMYSFGNDSQMVIADGPGANLYATVQRAILGGTGIFNAVSGQMTEVNLGMNKTGFCNLRITFKIKKSAGSGHKG